jgi:endoglucanase
MSSMKSARVTTLFAALLTSACMPTVGRDSISSATDTDGGVNGATTEDGGGGTGELYPDGGMGSGSGSGSGGGTAMATGRIRIKGKDLVDEAGKTVRLTGINWFGFETDTYAPHGLWARSMDSMLDQIKSAGFNTLRVPFSSQMFEPGIVPKGVDTTLNPDLVGKTAPQLLDILIAKCGTRDLRVILDRHRPDATGQSELWYTAAYPESRWISDWMMIAQKYKANPVVVAFDLHNEPHASATWGSGNMATDWRLAAQRAGNAILSVHPDALIIVEGVEIHAGNYYWWGGNLRGVAAAPVQLSAPDHVIYSPHEYPSSIYAQSWFGAADYPANLPGVWDATWGNVAATAPVLVGEFGTKLESDSDKKWLASLVQYIKTKNMSFTYWSLNPNSGDTGGILADDWQTLRQDKLTALMPALAPIVPVP